MTFYELITKLVGPIQPLADHSRDQVRLKNLKDMTELISEIIRDIHVAALHADSHAASVKAIGVYAKAFLTELRAELPGQDSVWVCGCGHLNGCNLAECACCERKPG